MATRATRMLAITTAVVETGLNVGTNQLFEWPAHTVALSLFMRERATVCVGHSKIWFVPTLT